MSQKFFKGFLKEERIIGAGLPVYSPLRVSQCEGEFMMGSRPEHTVVANFLRINTDEKHTHNLGLDPGGKERSL